MEIIKPSIRPVKLIDGAAILVELETAARKCYKSEDKLTAKNAGKVVGACITSGHESIIEHIQLSFDVTLDNGVLREWTRHRIGSYSVESTRYCDYGKRGMRFIAPLEFEPLNRLEELTLWREACESSEVSYNKLRTIGAQPQEAREVLNFSVACDMRFTANLRSLRNLLRLRCAKEAHLHMRELCIPLLLYLKREIPIIFDDIPYDENFLDEYFGGNQLDCIEAYINPTPTLKEYDDIINELRYSIRSNRLLKGE